MKADKSIKLMELVNKYPSKANAWWMDDNEGAMYMIYHEMNNMFALFQQDMILYRRTARIQSWRTTE